MAKAEIKINNLIKLHTLLLLSKGRVHGYEVIKALEHNLGARISASQVYPFLNLLEKRKYINYLPVDKRDKKQYSLTASGREFMRGITARFATVIDLAIQPKIRACAHCSCEVYKGGYEQRIGGKTLYFCCSNCAKSCKGQRLFAQKI